MAMAAAMFSDLSILLPNPRLTIDAALHLRADEIAAARGRRIESRPSAAQADSVSVHVGRTDHVCGRATVNERRKGKHGYRHNLRQGLAMAMAAAMFSANIGYYRT